MNAFFNLCIFWIVYGIAGLCGFQIIDKKFKGKTWTKHYIRGLGVSWLMLGIPFLIVFLVTESMALDPTLAYILFAIPAIIYTCIHEKKYKAMLSDNIA